MQPSLLPRIAFQVLQLPQVIDLVDRSERRAKLSDFNRGETTFRLLRAATASGTALHTLLRDTFENLRAVTGKEMTTLRLVRSALRMVESSERGEDDRLKLSASGLEATTASRLQGLFDKFIGRISKLAQTISERLKYDEVRKSCGDQKTGRKAQRVVALGKGVEPNDEGARSPADSASLVEEKELIVAGIEALPQSLASVARCRLLDEMSVEETAATLGISTTVVHTRLNRARGALRLALSHLLQAAA